MCVHDVASAEVGVVKVNNAALFRRRQLQKLFFSHNLSAMQAPSDTEAALFTQ